MIAEKRKLFFSTDTAISEMTQTIDLTHKIAIWTMVFLLL